MTTTNLALPQPSASQNQKTVTISDTFERVDKVITERVDIDCTAGGVVVVAANDFRDFLKLNLTGAPGAGFTLELPSRKRLFLIFNNSGQTATVRQTATPGTTVVVAAGEKFILYASGAVGSNVEAYGGAAGSVTFDALTDTPANKTGASLFGLRVNAAETAIEYAALSPTGNNWALPFKGAVASRVAAFNAQNFTTVTRIPWDTKTLSAPYNGFHFFLGANLNFVVLSDVNETLTATAHDMVSGDGPFQLITTGTLPTGLALVTDYWAILVDANTIKLASSLANALAGTPVNITGSGTGTHTLDRNKRLVVPTGVTKVRVGGVLRISNAAAATNYEVTIPKNTVANYIGNPNTVIQRGTAATLGQAIASGPIAVTAGDFFTLSTLVVSDASVDVDVALSHFWIEVMETSEGTNPPEELTHFAPGTIAATTLLWQKVASRAFRLADEFAGSRAFAVTAPSGGTAVFDVERNGSAIGTITFANGVATATFTTTGGSTEDFAIGDRIAIRSQAALNGIAGVSFNLLGWRT